MFQCLPSPSGTLPVGEPGKRGAPTARMGSDSGFALHSRSRWLHKQDGRAPWASAQTGGAAHVNEMAGASPHWTSSAVTRPATARLASESRTIGDTWGSKLLGITDRRTACSSRTHQEGKGRNVAAHVATLTSRQWGESCPVPFEYR